MDIFQKCESEVRSYCRSFDAVFARAEDCFLYDERGRRYIDFFAGAGSMNYGHNHPALKEKLLAYIADNGLTHSLDLHTAAKRRFLKRFHEIALQPRGLSHKVMFPGPTGTNSVESAIKIARKATGRTNIICFTNAFHGMTLGALALTGDAGKRGAAGLPLAHAVSFPYDGYLGSDFDTIRMLAAFLEDGSSGLDTPAAVIVETVQAEGGINVARNQWLRDLAALSKKHGILLIVDDIQVGFGRTGPLFSFERAGIEPDIITLSKALSGYGLPFSLTLIKPEYDLWKPGEHNGTFRGNNLAFVTAAEALNFWIGEGLTPAVEEKASLVRARLHDMVERYGAGQAVARGEGLIQGVAFADSGFASRLSRKAFELGLIVETSGSEDQTLKLLPPLTIDLGDLKDGLDIIEESWRAIGA